MTRKVITEAELISGITLPSSGGHFTIVVKSDKEMTRVRLTGMFFALDKCFLLPSAMQGIKEIAQQYDMHPNSHLLIVGHTDTSGEDDYNLTLSLERAEAVAAFLQDKVADWEDYFADSKPEAKRWGMREIQLMLSALPDFEEEKFLTEEDISGEDDAVTQVGVKAFQKAHQLKEDGIAGPKTRKALIKAYMELDGTTLPHDADNTIKITTHGCGENFPLIKTGDGVQNDENRRVEIFFFEGDIKPEPAADKKSKKGTKPHLFWNDQVTHEVHVPVKKAYHEHAIKEDFDGFIFYNPAQEKYLLLETQEEFKAFSTSVDKSHALRGKTALAWEKSSSKERKEELEKTKKEWEELFEGKVLADADKGLEEILLVKGNKSWGKVTAFTHVPSAWTKDDKKIPGRWAKHSDKALQKQLDKLLHKDDEKKGALEKKFKMKLFESEPMVGSIWPWAHMSRKIHEKKDENEDDHFDLSAEAALCRYAAGYKGEAEFDIKERKLKIEGSGSASFSVVEGKISGSWYLPDRGGINLLGFLCMDKSQKVCRENGHACLLRVSISSEGNVFAGISVSGALAFPAIDLSTDVKKRKVETSAKAEGLLGARAAGEIKLEIKWSPDPKTEFAELGNYGGEVGGTAGIAAGAEFNIGYSNGRFQFKCSASLAIGLGGKAGLAIEIGVDEAYHFIKHITESADSHYVSEIAQAAFVTYKNFAFAKIVEAELILEHGAHKAIDEVHNFEHWLSKNINKIDKIKSRIIGAPLRQIMYKDIPPEALGQAIITLMHGRETADFPAILDILKSAESDHKFKWILRITSQISLPNRDNPTYEKTSGEALKAGIKRINDFGYGIGYSDSQHKEPKSNENFLDQFQELLQKNGIR